MEHNISSSSGIGYMLQNNVTSSVKTLTKSIFDSLENGIKSSVGILSDIIKFIQDATKNVTSSLIENTTRYESNDKISVITLDRVAASEKVTPITALNDNITRFTSEITNNLNITSNVTTNQQFYKAPYWKSSALFYICIIIGGIMWILYFYVLFYTVKEEFEMYSNGSREDENDNGIELKELKVNDRDEDKNTRKRKEEKKKKGKKIRKALSARIKKKKRKKKQEEMKKNNKVEIEVEEEARSYSGGEAEAEDESENEAKTKGKKDTNITVVDVHVEERREMNSVALEIEI